MTAGGTARCRLRPAGGSRLVKIQATGKNASYAVTPPPTVDVVLGDGTCFEATFPGPTPPFCHYNGSQATLICR